MIVLYELLGSKYPLSGVWLAGEVSKRILSWPHSIICYVLKYKQYLLNIYFVIMDIFLREKCLFIQIKVGKYFLLNKRECWNSDLFLWEKSLHNLPYALAQWLRRLLQGGTNFYHLLVLLKMRLLTKTRHFQTLTLWFHLILSKFYQILL